MQSDTNNTNRDTVTDYLVYIDRETEEQLVNRLTSIFVQAFIKTELDTLINKRSNIYQIINII